jgi:DNA-directed RNA polymerase specialized sigma24 family protein
MTAYQDETMSRAAFEQAIGPACQAAIERVVYEFGDEELAEEVSQGVMVKAFEVWMEDPRYFVEHDLARWSSQRAVWRALDQLRRRGRHQPLPEERRGDDRPVSVPGMPMHDPVLAGEREHRRQLTWDLIQTLPEEQRRIIEGAYYDGRTDQELGNELFGPSDSPQANGLKVWRRRHGAHALLRERFLAAGIDRADWISQAI